MAVIIKYVVERNGEEKMTFTSKTDADSYDKMLDMADDLFDLLEKSTLINDETQLEEISLFLAQNREDVLCALGAKRKATPKIVKNEESNATTENENKDEDENKNEGENAA